MEQASKSRSLRAPQGDGQTLIEPPLRSLPATMERNRLQLSRSEYDMQGRPLGELAASARAALVGRAVEYTVTYRKLPDSLRERPWDREAPLVLSGHQPQLFHPGVWYKNFVLGSLAGRTRGVGIHLLIDSDLCRSVSVRVPTGSARDPRLEAVPYDEPGAEVPYEERKVRDEVTLARFADRVATLIRPLVREPLVESLWPLITGPRSNEANLGLRLAQGRHALEATYGNDTLELPLSAVCELPEFHWFLAHVLAHLPRFWSAYNDALADYRRLHRQRSRAHPVPDLAEIEGWLEAPFWIWSRDDPARRPLFARQVGDELHLSDRQAREYRLPLTAERDAAAAVEQLQDMAGRGVKIRTRALTTTLFARAMLSDLFLHGIGGATYDQVTDRIGQSFFGFALPEFAAVSATLRLPIDEREDFGGGPPCRQQLRELRFHPERFIAGNGVEEQALSSAGAIIAAKRQWVETPKTPGNARARHEAIASANESLQPFVAKRRREIEANCEESQRRKRAHAILASRDYAFCLYPRRHFQRLLDDL